MKWVRRFLGMAELISRWSKDPTTGVGAVAVDANRRIVETGYNGLPRGVKDDPERMKRPDKYFWTAHAEENLVAHAARDRLAGTTVIVTHLCCSNCTRMLINAGVRRIICGPGITSMPAENFDVSRKMMEEAGIELIMADGSECYPIIP